MYMKSVNWPFYVHKICEFCVDNSYFDQASTQHEILVNIYLLLVLYCLRFMGQLLTGAVPSENVECIFK